MKRLSKKKQKASTKIQLAPFHVAEISLPQSQYENTTGPWSLKHCTAATDKLVLLFTLCTPSSSVSYGVNPKIWLTYTMRMHLAISHFHQFVGLPRTHVITCLCECAYNIIPMNALNMKPHFMCISVWHVAIRTLVKNKNKTTKHSDKSVLHETRNTSRDIFFNFYAHCHSFTRFMLFNSVIWNIMRLTALV